MKLKSVVDVGEGWSLITAEMPDGSIKRVKVKLAAESFQVVPNYNSFNEIMPGSGDWVSTFLTYAREKGYKKNKTNFSRKHIGKVLQIKRKVAKAFIRICLDKNLLSTSCTNNPRSLYCVQNRYL